MRINERQAQQRLRDRGYVVSVDGRFGPESFTALLGWVANVPIVQMHRDLGGAMAKHLPTAEIDTPLRLSHFLGRSCVETGGFKRLVESLNYSVEALLTEFGRHRISVADALRLGRKDGRRADQEAIANLIYGGKFGREQLGNIAPGDGWRLRGRGLFQTTGLSNHEAFKAATGIDVVANPELLADPDLGTHAACVFWEKKGCGPIADRDDFTALTRKINGGTKGLVDGNAALKRAKTILL